MDKRWRAVASASPTNCFLVPATRYFVVTNQGEQNNFLAQKKTTRARPKQNSPTRAGGGGAGGEMAAIKANSGAGRRCTAPLAEQGRSTPSRFGTGTPYAMWRVRPHRAPSPTGGLGTGGEIKRGNWSFGYRFIHQIGRRSSRTAILNA